MSDRALIPFEMTAREEPLEPVAAVGFGPVARALAARLLAMPAADLARLRGVAGQDVVAVLGPAEHLPWVDGVVYCGRDERAPSLLLPTTRAPTVAPALLERALLARFPSLFPPLLWTDRRVVPMGRALPVEPALLTRFAEVGT